MACNATLAGIGVPCKTKIGGVHKVLLSQWSDGFWNAATAGAIDDCAAAQTVLTYEIAKGSGSFNQTVDASLENGAVAFTQELTFNIAGYDAATLSEIHEVMQSRLAVVVVDMNGQGFVMGALNGAECSGGTAGVGQGASDLHGLQVTLTAIENAPAPTGPSTSQTNLTVTAAP